MGNTTIIELNHDRWDEIQKNPEEFVQQVLEQLGCFKYSKMAEKHSFLDGRIHGGYVIAGFHRSGEDTGNDYDLWNKFKAKLRKYYGVVRR